MSSGVYRSNYMHLNQLIRVGDVIRATGDTRSTFYAKTQDGLMPQPIKISARAAALPASEVAAINAARIRGAGDDELRALVKQLHAARATAGA